MLAQHHEREILLNGVQLRLQRLHDAILSTPREVGHQFPRRLTQERAPVGAVGQHHKRPVAPTVRGGLTLQHDDSRDA